MHGAKAAKCTTVEFLMSEGSLGFRIYDLIIVTGADRLGWCHDTAAMTIPPHEVAFHAGLCAAVKGSMTSKMERGALRSGKYGQSAFADPAPTTGRVSPSRRLGAPSARSRSCYGHLLRRLSSKDDPITPQKFHPDQ